MTLSISTISVSNGEILFIKGANGSGKTTLLKKIATQYAPQCHYIGHKNAIKPLLTVSENCQYHTTFSQIEIKKALVTLGLTPYANQLTKNLSWGQQRRLALARVLLSKQNLWILDEPEAGLDHKARETLAQMINQHLDSAGQVVIATHGDQIQSLIKTQKIREIIL